MNSEGVTFTRQSEVGRISHMVLKHPKEAFIGDSVIGRQWLPLNYLAPPDYAKAVAEYDGLVDYFLQAGMALDFLDRDSETNLDSIYVRDTSVICDKGAILCNMGKSSRGGEPAAVERYYRDAGIPILGRIAGQGILEGGDVIWLDERTIIVGQGYRSNAEGIRQLKAYLGDSVDEVVAAQLPHWRGPSDVFHLMSIFSPVDHHKALVFSPLMPVVLREFLLHRGYQLIEVPEEEFETMACNVLAIAPGRCLMLSGNPQTRSALEREGIEVTEYTGQEISIKGAGGPTCLTRPIARQRSS